MTSPSQNPEHKHAVCKKHFRGNGSTCCECNKRTDCDTSSPRPENKSDNWHIPQHHYDEAWEKELGSPRTDWREEFDKQFTNSYAGDSGFGGNDPQEPVYEWATNEPSEVKTFIASELQSEREAVIAEAIKRLYTLPLKLTLRDILALLTNLKEKDV